jgi:hypothetical protein
VLFIRWRVGAERRGESWPSGDGWADFFLVFDAARRKGKKSKNSTASFEYSSPSQWIRK